MRRGEVWWVAFDPAVGTEIQKTRPAVIVSNDIANRYLGRVTVMPLTGNTINVYPGETVVMLNSAKSKAMANQLMTADKSRFHNRLGALSSIDMAKIDYAIRTHLDLL
jgi:mRNA interferase MazF